MNSACTAGLAFDALAPTYDTDFTHTHIGRAQRDAVLASAFRTFAGRQHILELNCGTGEDAVRLASAGWDVLALDASEQMIAVALRRSPSFSGTRSLRFRHLATEAIGSLNETFDGVFSNFSGLNCVADLGDVAQDLARLTTAGSPLVLCMSTRFCIWETLWYAITLQPRKGIRRWTGITVANLKGHSLSVFYPRVRDVRKTFGPYFRLERVQAIGLCVPPSYVERYIAGAPWVLRLLIALDALLSRTPGLRVLGDHMLLTLRKEDVAQ